MNQIFLDMFFEQVANKGKEMAVEDPGNVSLSYAQMNDWSDRVYRYLVDKGIGREDVVVINLPRGAYEVAAIIGIMRAGAVFTVVEGAYTVMKMDAIIEECEPALVINEECWKEVAEYEERSGEAGMTYCEVDEHDAAYIVFTSGSTGTPKGVVLNHKSFFDFIDWAINTFQFGNDLIMGSLSPIVFDIYSFELCMLMAKASTLVVLPAHLAAFPAKILEVLEQHKVNFLFWVPTIMVNIANMDLLSAFKLESLKTVWFAGEVFPTKQYNYWHHHLPQVTFANLYGPIEITLDCTFYIVDEEIPDEQPLPIGYPCRNTDILILDNEDRLVSEPGAEGELCVRGTSLAMGYYNNPEKTAAAFVQNPLNKAYPELIYRTGDIVCYDQEGRIMFKGRKDNIVKHMGYRTDLGEIEHVIINTLKLVKNGCIVYNQAEKQITLFYEAPEEIPVPQFRMEISKVLPKYMIPTAYHRLEQLQRNTNGKIDRLYYKKEVNK